MFEECGRQTEGGACLYYKLTNEPKGSDERISLVVSDKKIFTVFYFDIFGK